MNSTHRSAKGGVTKGKIVLMTFSITGNLKFPKHALFDCCFIDNNIISDILSMKIDYFYFYKNKILPRQE